jgi:dolichol-phosphate mannosyltransferase|tara:strand:+ start:203 stop:898 length:696 start_codon:yes stop_codon:yes gene_type:complete
MSKTLVFTATYNEVQNIKKLISLIYKNFPKADILVIDDNSPDLTYKLLKKLKKKYKNLKIKLRDKKYGLDSAHKFAYDFAKKNGYVKLITMDADLSHNPIEIKKIVRLLDKSEFVIGSRYIKGGKCELPLLRYLISFFGNKFIKFFLGIKCNEFTTSYRGFNLIKLKNFSLKKIKSKGYSFFMETVYLINKKNFKITEIPIKFKNRIYGKSKIPKIEILRTFFNVIRLKSK